MTSQEEFLRKYSLRENSKHDYLIREYDPKTQKWETNLVQGRGGVGVDCVPYKGYVYPQYLRTWPDLEIGSLADVIS